MDAVPRSLGANCQGTWPKSYKSYKRECQETLFSVGSVPTLFLSRHSAQPFERALVIEWSCLLTAFPERYESTGLLFLCLEHVEHWERIASRWRPAFSSHLRNGFIVMWEFRKTQMTISGLHGTWLA